MKMLCVFVVLLASTTLASSRRSRGFRPLEGRTVKIRERTRRQNGRSEILFSAPRPPTTITCSEFLIAKATAAPSCTKLRRTF